LQVTEYFTREVHQQQSVNLVSLFTVVSKTEIFKHTDTISRKKSTRHTKVYPLASYAHTTE